MITENSFGVIYNNRNDVNKGHVALLKTIGGWAAMIPACCLAVAISFTNMSIVSVEEASPFWSGVTFMFDFRLLVLGQLVGIVGLSAICFFLIRKNFSRCLDSVFDCIFYFIIAVLGTFGNLFTVVVVRMGFTGMFGSPVLPYGEDIVLLFLCIFYVIIITDTLLVIALKIMK